MKSLAAIQPGPVLARRTRLPLRRHKRQGITLVILPAMKTAISIPDRVFDAAEELAGKLGISRSELYVRAISALLERYRDDRVTERLNEIHAEEGPDLSLDPALVKAQSRAVGQEKW